MSGSGSGRGSGTISGTSSSSNTGLSLVPSVVWMINGNVIASYSASSSERAISNVSKYDLDIDPFSNTYGHLTLFNTMLEDAGVYTCMASNTEGSQSSSTQLQIQGRHRMLSEDNNTDIMLWF